MWQPHELDTLVEGVLTRLLSDGVSAGCIAYDLACELSRVSPQLPALSLNLPFTMAAHAVEDMLGASQDAVGQASDAWRVAALIGAEVLALELLATGAGDVTISDLFAQWQKGDMVFRPTPSS